MKLASIELISEINCHPNADKLELAKVLGYTCIVEKGKYKMGDAVVLIQPDTVLPNEPWAEMFKKRGSRVKALRLRNIWSFGTLVKTSLNALVLPNTKLLSRSNWTPKVLCLLGLAVQMRKDGKISPIFHLARIPW